ncbi:SDR family oxidoreductase [Pseudahrensia aquimaris]|uniref:SDR family oxidoreductase n=1 Tax=Pseudahrensia aquimaris TaxID=744461 RepID=A0ABW3FHF7_9HYPH
MNMLVLGAGFSGTAIAQTALKHGATVFGTTRSDDKAARLEELGITPIVFDGANLSPALEQALGKVTHLIVSIAPPRAEADDPDAIVDPTLQALGDLSLTKAAPSLRWIGYLSTVGVYGNHDGAWVDEATPAKPTSERSRQRVRAEAEWMAVGEATGLPVGTFRLSGIYGPGRNAFRTIEKGKSRRLVKQGQVFNRIHVGDIAQALCLAADKRADGIFNITDDLPAPPQDVVTFAHELMGVEPPPEIDFETADLSPMARSFYGENKRVSNAKSKAVLGLEYRWPDYRTALQRMWDEKDW